MQLHKAQNEVTKKQEMITKQKEMIDDMTMLLTNKGMYIWCYISQCTIDHDKASSDRLPTISYPSSSILLITEEDKTGN